jgi:hypothetical protein
VAVEASARLRHRGERAKRSAGRAPGGGRRSVGKPSPRAGRGVPDQVAGAVGDERIAEIQATQRRLTEVHLTEVPEAQRPMMAAPEAVDEQALRQREAELLVADVPWFRRRARQAARAEAERNVEAQVARLRIARIDALERAQERSDQIWQALLDHDPETVRDAVETALARVVTVCGVVDLRPRERRQAVCVVVAVDGVVAVPDQTVVVGADGAPTLRSRTPDETHAIHLRAVASTVLASAGRVLAASPSTELVTVVAARRAPAEADVEVWTAVYAGTFARELWADDGWREQDPVRTVTDQPDAAIQLTGARREVDALHPSAHPDVNRSLAVVAARSRMPS